MWCRVSSTMASLCHWANTFVPHDAMLTRYMLSSCVCPSVTWQYCIKIFKCRIAETMPYNSVWTIVFWCQKSRRNSNGVTPNGAPNSGEVRSNVDFWPISCCISETVQDRDILTMECWLELVCSIDWCYFQWPQVTLTTPNHPISTFCITFHIFVVSRDNDLNLVGR